MAFFDKFLSPTVQGLLGAGAQLQQAGSFSTTPTSFGQAMGQGLLGFGQGVTQAQKMQLENEKLRRELEEKRVRQGLLQRFFPPQAPSTQPSAQFMQPQAPIVPPMIDSAIQAGQAPPPLAPLLPVVSQEQAQAPGISQAPMPQAMPQAPTFGPNDAFALSLIDPELGSSAFKQIEAQRQLENTQRQAAQDALTIRKLQREDVLNLPQVQREEALRKEFASQEVVEDARRVMTSFNKVSKSLSSGTAAGDLTAIFNYMKMTDPRSVVRESEFKTAEQAKGWLGKMDKEGNSVPNFIRTGIQRATEGQILLPEQREDFFLRAQDLAAAEQESFEHTAQFFSDVASRAGIDPQDVILGLPKVNVEGVLEKIRKQKQAQQSAQTAQSSRAPIDKKFKDTIGFKPE